MSGLPAGATGGERRPRLAILVSGRGSNAAAIAQAVAAGAVPADIALVFSNRPGAPGLDLAHSLGLETQALASAGREREVYDRLVVKELQARQVDWICLAGYMRLLSGYFIQAFPQRILNIHPSLLPAFPGLEAQRQALEYGVQFTGCTVHLVDETVDGGPILRQAVVPVLEHDDTESLSARILEQEHRIYPEALRLMLSGQYQIDGRRVRTMTRKEPSVP